MKRFTSSIRKSVSDQNFFGALFLSLAMPDICGALEDPNKGVGDRYKKWFRKYLNAKYDSRSNMEYALANSPQLSAVLAKGITDEIRNSLNAPFPKELRFTATDCYMFRCKCLHQGMVQRANEEQFIFISSLPTGTRIHRNLYQGKLVLQIECFAEDICLAVEEWELSVKNNPNIQSRIDQLITIDKWHDL